MPSQEPSSPSEPQNSVPTLFDFIYLVPSPVTIELVALSPYISYIRHAAEIASWKSSWPESWLALAAWWALCLFAYPGLRYFLPVILIPALTSSRWRSSHRLNPPVTEHNLQTTISDISTIRALIPNLPLIPAIPIPTLARIIAFIYLPYLVLTYLLPLRVLFGIGGTFLITWRAPWAFAIRHALWSCAYIRWGAYHLASHLTGKPLPPPTLSVQSTPTPVNSIRFLFTIYENQRWWMALDWTAALLPAERPSWCSVSQTAVSPPNAFSLPEPAVAFLGDGKGGRVKRTATWNWEEGEWKVLIRKDDGAKVTRVERPLPDEKDSPSTSRILKAVAKKKDGSSEKIAATDETSEDPFEGEEEIDTDPDGWIYGDNKWEGASAKGGLGKYTRYRRWTRLAVLSETVESVDGGEVGVVRPVNHSELEIVTPPSNSHLPLPTLEASPSNSLSSESPKDGTRGLLRQRLKAALDGSTL